MAGHWQIRTLLTEEQMADVHPAPGDRVEVRMAACPSFVFGGVVSRVASAGSRTIPVESLTHLGGGNIAVNPLTLQAGQSHFEVTIDLPDGGTDALGHGMTGRVRFRAGSDSIGTLAVRRLIRFANSLQQH